MAASLTASVQVRQRGKRGRVLSSSRIKGNATYDPRTDLRASWRKDLEKGLGGGTWGRDLEKGLGEGTWRRDFYSWLDRLVNPDGCRLGGGLFQLVGPHGRWRMAEDFSGWLERLVDATVGRRGIHRYTLSRFYPTTTVLGPAGRIASHIHEVHLLAKHFITEREVGEGGEVGEWDGVAA